MSCPASNLDPVDLKLTSKKMPDKAKCVVKVAWFQDHPDDWSAGKYDKNALEDRKMPGKVLMGMGEISGDSVTLQWKPTWSETPFNDNQQMKEIYGVIRAEYHFMTSGWRKLASKVGPTGFDSLFKKGGTFVICESKAGTGWDSFVDYRKGTAKEKERVALERLSDTERKPRHKKLIRMLESIVGKVNVPRLIKQMSRRWVLIKVAEMLGRSKKRPADSAERIALRKKIGENARALIDSDDIERWFNYYGTDPFYRLPGVYKIIAARKREIRAPDDIITQKDKKFDWPPSDTPDDREFILLDECEEFIRTSGDKPDQAIF